MNDYKLRGSSMSSTQEIMDAIDGERAYQRELNENDADISIAAELLLLEEYIQRARAIWIGSIGDGRETATRDAIRKVAGIAVRCMENHGVVFRGDV